MAAKPARRKNPGTDVLPHMDPAYPIRPLIDTATHIKATVVILPIPGKAGFVASTLEDRKILVTGSTRKTAQRAALDAYVQKQGHQHNPRISDEDRQDLELIRKARKELRVPWEKVKRELGL